MKKIFTVALLSVLAVVASAQELNNFSRGRQQVKSPEINGEKVTFRLNANYATVVNLQGNWMENGSIPMQKGQNGVSQNTSRCILRSACNFCHALCAGKRYQYVQGNRALEQFRKHCATDYTHRQRPQRRTDRWQPKLL